MSNSFIQKYMKAEIKLATFIDIVRKTIVRIIRPTSLSTCCFCILGMDNKTVL